MKEIRDYLCTYNHTIPQESKTQTLDLLKVLVMNLLQIECNQISSAWKEEWQIKLDILKAIHYCILLHFSGLHTLLR